MRVLGNLLAEGRQDRHLEGRERKLIRARVHRLFEIAQPIADARCVLRIEIRGDLFRLAPHHFTFGKPARGR